MSLFITSLNSGSNGNCYYVGNHTDAVLVDAGISCREIEKRMLRLSLPVTSIRAIFISHEHTDHISGIKTLSKKFQIPVYITSQTLRSAGVITDKHLLNSFSPGKPVHVSGISVTGFTKCHDASDPHSFMVSYNGINVGVFTDIGNCCEEVNRYFKMCHAAFLESNYCEQMLMNGKYPWYLKQRISSDKGHLSNTQAMSLFNQFRNPALSHLILSHLSRENNSPELVGRLFNEIAGSTKIVVASRYEETPVYSIAPAQPLPQPVYRKVRVPASELQLSLF